MSFGNHPSTCPCLYCQGSLRLAEEDLKAASPSAESMEKAEKFLVKNATHMGAWGGYVFKEKSSIKVRELLALLLDSERAQAREAAENREDALARELAGVKVTCEWHKLEQTRRREAAEDAYDVTRTRLETAEKELAAFQHSYAAEKAARYGAEARVCEMQADFDAAVHSFNHVFPDRDVDSGPPHQRFGMLLRFLAARLQGVQQEAKDLEFQNELYREAVEAVVEDSEDDGPINWGLNSVQNAKGVLERFKALARTETPKPYEASDAAACNEAYPESCPHLPPHKHKE